MARRPAYPPLQALMNGRLVGRLERESTGAIRFQYAAQWLAWKDAMPVSLSLPLRQDSYRGEAVFAFFDNLLPDNDRIRRAVAERTGASGVDPYNLLSVIGRDCVGALQFLPDDEVPPNTRNIKHKPLTHRQVGDILNNLQIAPLGVDRETGFRISIAGAQEKTALLWRDDTWNEPQGATPTTHIIKPAIGKLPNGLDLSMSVENEYLCLKVVEACGLPVAKASIEKFGRVKALVVERFDRAVNGKGILVRLPQEDCCQALSVPPTLKYQSEGGPGIAQILTLLRASDYPGGDQKKFLKAQFLFWLLGATDGHAKNFSIALKPGGQFQLAPLYDIMSAQPNVDAGQVRWKDFKLAMSAGDNRHYRIDQISLRHFRQTAARARVATTMIDQIAEELLSTVPAAVKKVQETMPPRFPAVVYKPIFEGVAQRLRTLECEWSEKV